MAAALTMVAIPLKGIAQPIAAELLFTDLLARTRPEPSRSEAEAELAQLDEGARGAGMFSSL